VGKTVVKLDGKMFFGTINNNLSREARLVYHQFRGREAGGKSKQQSKKANHLITNI
jgi:hypothetical protein